MSPKHFTVSDLLRSSRKKKEGRKKEKTNERMKIKERKQTEKKTINWHAVS